MVSKPTLLINGELTGSVSSRDRGLAFGDGLFETTAAIDGIVRFAHRHLDRLELGCARLAIPAPGRALLQREMARVAAGQRRAVVKIIVTRGSGGIGYAPPAQCEPTRIVQRLAWPVRDADEYAEGIDIGVCNTRVARQPALAGLKHLNRLEQVLGRAEMAARGLAEGLMLDERDNVVEATAANLFAAVDGVLTTPRLDLCGVRGVMREVVVDAARELGLPVRCGRLDLMQLLGADEVFLTNSLAGLLPVRRLRAGSTVACWQPGPAAAAISRSLADAAIHPCGRP